MRFTVHHSISIALVAIAVTFSFGNSFATESSRPVKITNQMDFYNTCADRHWNESISGRNSVVGNTCLADAFLEYLNRVKEEYSKQQVDFIPLKIENMGLHFCAELQEMINVTLRHFSSVVAFKAMCTPSKSLGLWLRKTMLGQFDVTVAEDPKFYGDLFVVAAQTSSGSLSPEEDNTLTFSNVDTIGAFKPWELTDLEDVEKDAMLKFCSNLASASQNVLNAVPRLSASLKCSLWKKDANDGFFGFSKEHTFVSVVGSVKLN